MPGTPNPESISTRLPRIADRVHDGVPVAQQTHDLTSRMRESRTSGSVGALGRQLPRATRLTMTAGKGAEGERVAEGPAVARKVGNATGAMGPCCSAVSLATREAGVR